MKDNFKFLTLVCLKFLNIVYSLLVLPQLTLQSNFYHILTLFFILGCTGCFSNKSRRISLADFTQNSTGTGGFFDHME